MLTPEQETFLANFAQRELDNASLSQKTKEKNDALVALNNKFETDKAAVIAAYEAEVAKG